MDSSSFFGPPRGVTMSERVPQSHWTLSECLTLVVLSGYLCLQGGQDPPSCSAILLVLALGSALYRKQAVRNRSLFPTREWTYLSGERRESGATRQVYWGDKGKKWQSVQAMLQGTGRTCLHFVLSL